MINNNFELTYRAISDFERIGDYSENIMEYADHLSDLNEEFSLDAMNEIDEVTKMINNLYDLTVEVYIKYDADKFKSIYKIEDGVDEYTEMMANNHIERMNKGVCTAEIGNEYLQLSSNVERIADHLVNINDKDYMMSH